MTKDAIENHLKTFIDPYYQTDLLTAKAVKHIEIEGRDVKLSIVLGFAAPRYLTDLQSALTAHLKALSDKPAL